MDQSGLGTVIELTLKVDFSTYIDLEDFARHPEKAESEAIDGLRRRLAELREAASINTGVGVVDLLTLVPEEIAHRLGVLRELETTEILTRHIHRPAAEERLAVLRLAHQFIDTFYGSRGAKTVRSGRSENDALEKLFEKELAAELRRARS